MPPFTFNLRKTGNFFRKFPVLLSSCRHFVDSLFLPQRGRMSAKLTGEGEGSKSGNVGRNGAWQTFSLITLQCTHWRELPPAGGSTDCRQSWFLSSRTSDRCHWCGDPYPKSLENTTFLKKNGLPRQCAHWLAMTHFGVCLHIECTLRPPPEGASAFSLYLVPKIRSPASPRPGTM